MGITSKLRNTSGAQQSTTSVVGESVGAGLGTGTEDGVALRAFERWVRVRLRAASLIAPGRPLSPSLRATLNGRIALASQVAGAGMSPGGRERLDALVSVLTRGNPPPEELDAILSLLATPAMPRPPLTALPRERRALDGIRKFRAELDRLGDGTTPDMARAFDEHLTVLRDRLGAAHPYVLQMDAALGGALSHETVLLERLSDVCDLNDELVSARTSAVSLTLRWVDPDARRYWEMRGELEVRLDRLESVARALRGGYRGRPIERLLDATTARTLALTGRVDVLFSDVVSLRNRLSSLHGSAAAVLGAIAGKPRPALHPGQLFQGLDTEADVQNRRLLLRELQAIEADLARIERLFILHGPELLGGYQSIPTGEA